MQGFEYECCEGGIMCDQHWQQQQEYKRDTEIRMMERRKAGNSRAALVYGVLA